MAINEAEVLGGDTMSELPPAQVIKQDANLDKSAMVPLMVLHIV